MELWWNYGGISKLFKGVEPPVYIDRESILFEVNGEESRVRRRFVLHQDSLKTIWRKSAGVSSDVSDSEIFDDPPVESEHLRWLSKIIFDNEAERPSSNLDGVELLTGKQGEEVASGGIDDSVDEPTQHIADSCQVAKGKDPPPSKVSAPLLLLHAQVLLMLPDVDAAKNFKAKHQEEIKRWDMHTKGKQSLEAELEQKREKLSKLHVAMLIGQMASAWEWTPEELKQFLEADNRTTDEVRVADIGFAVFGLRSYPPETPEVQLQFKALRRSQRSRKRRAKPLAKKMSKDTKVGRRRP